MAELADALDLGSSGRPWGFKSLCPHQRQALRLVFFMLEMRLTEEGLERAEIEKLPVASFPAPEKRSSPFARTKCNEKAFFLDGFFLLHNEIEPCGSMIKKRY